MTDSGKVMLGIVLLVLVMEGCVTARQAVRLYVRASDVTAAVRAQLEPDAAASSTSSATRQDPS